MKRTRKTEDSPVVDLHPSEWDPDWQPPIGNDPLPGEKPHIWQEFKRDMGMQRSYDEPIIGRGWFNIVVAFLIPLAVGMWFNLEGSPAWLIALRNLLF